VTAFVSRQFAAGHLCFSPITHSHPICEAGGLNGDWDTWLEFDSRMLRACDRLAVLELPGYDQSKGVAAEIELAKSLGMPICHILPDEELKP
jgi:hypothetical protein